VDQKMLQKKSRLFTEAANFHRDQKAAAIGW
jgi:hypothetical protein